MKDITKWGKDHWSVLAYVESACVDRGGMLEKRCLRCNEKKHPLLKNSLNPKWENSCCTRMKEGVIEGHDDWDCLEDLEEMGFIEIISIIKGFVKITEQGKSMVMEIRSHKADGGNYANFTPLKN